MADPVNRLTAALTALIRELFPNWAYASVYRYTCISCNYETQTIEARPATDGVGLPPLTNVPLRSPVKLELQQGASLGIGFLDSDPTQPYIAALDQNMVVTRAKVRAEGVLELGEEATMQVARQGDLVVVPFTGVQVMFAVLPTGDPPVPPTPMTTMTPYFMAIGNITSPPLFPLAGQLIGFTSSGSQLAKVP